MIELPMLAFKLTGNDEYIGLSINEVYGFPEEIAYGGGYGAKGTLEISVGSYYVHADYYFTTGELYTFLCQLQKCYDSICGEAFLVNNEQELQLNICFEKNGKVIVSGEFQEHPYVDTKLIFEMATDQAAISTVIRELLNVFHSFGDEKGISQRL